MDREELAEVECNTHCNIMQHYATRGLKHTATHCNTLQHTATHCNTLNVTREIPHGATNSRKSRRAINSRMSARYPIYYINGLYSRLLRNFVSTGKEAVHGAAGNSETSARYPIHYMNAVYGRLLRIFISTGKEAMHGAAGNSETSACYSIDCV